MTRRTAPLLAALLGVLGCAAVPLHERPWVEVRTAHFVILSPLAQAQAVELARDLELFRAVVAVVTGSKLPPGPAPVRVFAFDGPSSYRPFAVPNAAGYFLGSMRQSTVVLSGADLRRIESPEVLQHEYVHFLLHNQGQVAYPPWYDEGLAEFLSNIQLKNGKVEVGRPLRERLGSLRSVAWLPLDQVIACRNYQALAPDQVGAFYAESWLFVHYLHFGRGEAETRRDMTRYLKALRGGSSDAEAVRLAFGADADDLGRQLQRYYRRGQFVFLTASPDAFDAGESPRARALSAAEVAGALGDLSNDIGESSGEIRHFEQAQRYFEAALAARSGDARAVAGLARALDGQNRPELAQARYEAAVALAPDDAVVELEFANHLHGRARAAADADERERLALQAREHYVRSWKLDDHIPETYAGYGATYLLDGQEATRGRETLEHAHRMLPSSPEIKLTLAKLYARTGRRDEALALARVVATWGHSQETEAELREIFESVDPPESP